MGTGRPRLARAKHSATIISVMVTTLTIAVPFGTSNDSSARTSSKRSSRVLPSSHQPLPHHLVSTHSVAQQLPPTPAPGQHFGTVVNHVARGEAKRQERVVKINPIGSKGIHINCPTRYRLRLHSSQRSPVPQASEGPTSLDQYHLSGVQSATGESVTLLGRFPCRLETRSLLIMNVIVVKDLKLEFLLGQNFAELLPGYANFLDSVKN